MSKSFLLISEQTIKELLVFSKEESENIEILNLLSKTNDGTSQIEKLNWNIKDFLMKFDKIDIDLIQFINICRKITVRF